MPLFLVDQLRFARSEFRRGLQGVTAEEAQVRFLPMNCISWMVAHLANQEQRYWLTLAQNKTPFPQLNDLAGHNRPASAPDLDEMWAAWQVVSAGADAFLDNLTELDLLVTFTFRGKPVTENTGTLLLRNIYHYWYHLGEAAAVRQMLGHEHLPEFVGPMNAAAFRLERHAY